MKRSGWALRSLFVLAAAVTFVLAGDALAGDKGKKKGHDDKKDKKGKKEQVVKKDFERIWQLIDPTRAHKTSRKGRSGGK
jgi:hypothetical protein